MLPRTLLLASLLAVATCADGTAAQGPAYKLLYSPPVSSNLGYMGSITEVDSSVFAVLSTWQSNTLGPSIFTITSAGTVKPIYTLDPSTLTDTMVQATGGNLYTPALLHPSGNSAYYSLSLLGKGVQQYPLPAQWGSLWHTVAAPRGEIYDILGIAPNGALTSAFVQISETGKITFLHQFSAADGFPTGNNMVYALDGNFYGIGTQQQHGVSPGFIFRFTPGGAYSQILTFPEFPGHSAFPLMAASDGNLYGTFTAGGANNTGEIYQVTLAGEFQTVASFPATGMTDPWTLMQAGDGNIYGTTNYNQIFRHDLATHQLTQVYQLDPGGSQGKCACMLVEGMDGKLYGVAPYGGSYPGYGTVFTLNIGLPKPKPAVTGLYPPSGPVGQQVILWGNYLLGATSVSFNGAPAITFSATTVQSVSATVPAGATSGPVTVTTANGSFTTTTSFTVQ